MHSFPYLFTFPVFLKQIHLLNLCHVTFSLGFHSMHFPLAFKHSNQRWCKNEQVTAAFSSLDFVKIVALNQERTTPKSHTNIVQLLLKPQLNQSSDLPYSDFPQQCSQTHVQVIWLCPGNNTGTSKQNNSYVQMKSVWLKKQLLKVHIFTKYRWLAEIDFSSKWIQLGIHVI